MTSPVNPTPQPPSLSAPNAPINIYFCHSPITYELARGRANGCVSMEEHVYISARECHPPESFFHLKQDGLGEKNVLLNFAKNFHFLIKGMADGDRPIRLFLPHVGSLAFRLMRLHPRIAQISLLEEGSMYYQPNLSSRTFGELDYMAQLRLGTQDLRELAKWLETPDGAIEHALRGNFQCFSNHDAKITGALITAPDALQSLDYRNALNIEMVKLERRLIPGLEEIILFLLPSHLQELTVKRIPIEQTWRKVTDVLENLRQMAKTVAIKFHPSDMPLRNMLTASYRQKSNVVVFEELNISPSFSTHGFQLEPSTLGFKAFYVGGSSARIYATRVWGIEKLIDKESAF